jgi:hypothetical protein
MSSVFNRSIDVWSLLIRAIFRQENRFQQEPYQCFASVLSFRLPPLGMTTGPLDAVATHCRSLSGLET